MSISVGEQLQQARVARGFSLDQAAQLTRIRRPYLEALERGDAEALPSRVQGRGFLRLYASHLGLNGEELVAAWEGRPSPAPAVPTAPATPTTAPTEPAAPPVAVQAPMTWPEPEPEPPALEEAEAEPAPPAALPASTAAFIKIGQDLRRQREILGLSLGDVERHTRLREHHLRALESGRIDDLPSTVQARGMLSNYASFLNMDADALMLRFAEGLQQRRIERTPPTPEPGGLLKARRRPTPAAAASNVALQVRRLVTPDMLLVGGLILAIFVFIVWAAAHITASGAGTAQATLPSVSDVLLYTASPSAPAVSGTPQAALPTAADAATSSAASSSAGAADQPTTQTTLPSGGITLTPTLGAINSDPIQVYIVARKRAFLEVHVDGKQKYLGLVAPGEAYPFSGQTSVEVLTGDASALQIFFNQNDQGVLGGSGEVLDLIYTRQGAEQPTPTITLTPTVTPRVTATPTPGSSTSPTPTPSVTPLVPQ